MSCMEHQCGTCGHQWENNRVDHRCPKCRSGDVSNWFDEFETEEIVNEEDLEDLD
jgi:predicted Zn-ribbon and HTH transcriptional regulator